MFLDDQVATLNDEKNWRTGMRVEILLERMVIIYEHFSSKVSDFL